jgi:pimeloyl-ACP methyl ester carboxylesterase
MSKAYARGGMVTTSRFAPVVLCVLLSQSLLGTLPALAAAPRPANALKPCHVEGVKEKVRCGTYSVWEDRAARRGRKINLNLVVLPALGPDRAPDAIFWLDGGPGAGGTRATGLFGDDPELRKHRDVVLIDQRGTGKSNPLNCKFYGAGAAADPRLLAGELFALEAVRACRRDLEKVADLTLYTTPIAMDDLDEVRAWLGYRTIDLYGGSYGSLAAQVFLRRHPEAVRSVVLDGVLPVDEHPPLHHAYAGKRAVDLLFNECAADAACHAAFPHLPEELQAVFERVDRGVTVRIPDPGNGGTVEVAPSRGLIAEGIRYMMYGSTAGQVPLAVHRAYEGDMVQLVELAVQRRAAMDHLLAWGMTFSVTCSEDLPYIDDATAARLAARTLLGEYRIREQKRVCTDWPRGTIPADEHELVRSPVPALLFSGERDPVTPPEFGDRVASGLPNSLHLVTPHGSHGVDGPCAEAIIRQFIAEASVRKLDTTCMAATPPTHFELK